MFGLYAGYVSWTRVRTERHQDRISSWLELSAKPYRPREETSLPSVPACEVLERLNLKETAVQLRAWTECDGPAEKVTMLDVDGEEVESVHRLIHT